MEKPLPCMSEEICFKANIMTTKETLVTGEHSLHVLEIIEAARKSGKTGERIKIESEFKWPVVP